MCMIDADVHAKKISAVIPCYNEGNSIDEMYLRLLKVFESIPEYDYEIIFVDDCSPDNTWEKIKEVCASNKKVRGIRNITNFGPARNVFTSVRYASGDAVFLLFGDLQQPPERLPDFIKYWREGYLAVVGVHYNTDQKGFIKFCREAYYGLMKKLFSKFIPYYNCYGLYDRKLMEIFDSIDDMQPYFTGVVSEYAGKVKTLPIRQERSRRGKSNQKFFMRYDYAMVGLTSYTKIMMRLATFIGFFFGVISILFAVFVFIARVFSLASPPAGVSATLVGIFTLGSIQIFFLGIMGEYILSINERSMKRPLVVVDEKINFVDDAERI